MMVDGVANIKIGSDDVSVATAAEPVPGLEAGGHRRGGHAGAGRQHA